MHMELETHNACKYLARGGHFSEPHPCALSPSASTCLPVHVRNSLKGMGNAKGSWENRADRRGQAHCM